MSTDDRDDIDPQLQSLLKAMPQPRASAELDAAILADAEAALARKPVPAHGAAANDADGGSGEMPYRAGFFTRWRTPFATAAAVLLAVHVGYRQWSMEPEYTAHETVGMASEAAAPAQAPSAAPAQSAPPAPRLQSKDSQENKLARAKPAQSAPLARQAPAAKAEQQREPVRERTYADSAVAAAPQAPPAPAPLAAAKSAPAEALADAPKAVMADRSAGAGATAARSVAPIVQAAPGPEALAKRADLPREERMSRAPAPAAADMASGVEAKVKAPAEWLAQIEKLIDEGKKKEALEEWGRFRKVYPSYEVEKRVLQKIEGLRP